MVPPEKVHVTNHVNIIAPYVFNKAEDKKKKK
jgi:hypothetical protein